MTFVGVTGVEDKLQEGVNETVSSLRSIGIKVWMLTGDKIETAICVGRAVRLIQGREERLFLIEGAKSKGDFLSKLEQFYNVLGLTREGVMSSESINCVLVIDGTSLKWALEEIAHEFFEIAVRLPAIICSRVSPTQKAEVALLVRQFGNGRVLGIGDGGNDVALIQSAHVGVGIYGKEGIQAALASDFSISTFKDLNGLLFWHGRLAYKRSSLLSQFIIHRGIIITIMQAIFTIQFFFVALPIYNGFLILGYSTIFTMLPVFSLVLDEDISREVALEYPILYKTTQAGNEVNAESFIYWLIISVYQVRVHPHREPSS
jgi:phospholipid-translocating ATPase